MTNLEKTVKDLMADNQYQLPEVRKLAKLMRVRQSEILEMIDDSEVLDLIVGFRRGNGIAEFKNTGDYQIEYYGDEE